MARKRQIDPIYPFEKEIRELSLPARYFYILSWCHMDDQNGVLPYDLFHLKNQIFPEEDIKIEPIIKELLALRRYYYFEAEGKAWLWCPTMKKHQNIQHPTKRAYPTPPKELQDRYNQTLNEPSMSPHIPLTKSRVELSRVDNKAQASPALKAALDKIYKDKLNIYSLLTRIKTESKSKVEIPEPVLLRVCDSYWKQKPNIKNAWSWLKRVVVAEWEAWNATEQIRQGKEWKSTPAILSIGEILKRKK